MGTEHTVLFDGYCSFCRTAQRAVDRLDCLELIRWVPFQSAAADRFGIPRDQLEQRMYVVAGEKQWSGFAGWKQILLRLPATYVLIASSCIISPYFLAGWLLFFVPITEPIGERVYDWIARNLYSLPVSTCQREL